MGGYGLEVGSGVRVASSPRVPSRKHAGQRRFMYAAMVTDGAQAEAEVRSHADK